MALLRPSRKSHRYAATTYARQDRRNRRIPAKWNGEMVNLGSAPQSTTTRSTQPRPQAVAMAIVIVALHRLSRRAPSVIPGTRSSMLQSRTEYCFELRSRVQDRMLPGRNCCFSSGFECACCPRYRNRLGNSGRRTPRRIGRNDSTEQRTHLTRRGWTAEPAVQHGPAPSYRAGGNL